MGYHLIGMGGIGMSGLAHLLLEKGESVQGSDAKSSAILEELVQKGAKLGGSCKDQRVVYSSAIRENHPEMQEAKVLGCEVIHRSELLAELMKGKLSLSVAGVHGKTSTSALLAYVLEVAGKEPSFAVGGVLTDFERNARKGKGPFFVAEADESDGSFLRLPRDGAIITNLEKEHLDYWKSEQALEEGFLSFVQGVKKRDFLFWCADSEGLAQLKLPGYSYGRRKGADLQIQNERFLKGGTVFDLCFQGRVYEEIQLTLLGEHNVLNAAAVFGLCLHLGLEEGAIREGLKGFSGVCRRLEFLGEKQGVRFYDDYAHHPTEVRAVLSALRQRYPERRLVVLFQPHRYSRCPLFGADPECFQLADQVLLSEVYPASESRPEGFALERFFKGGELALPLEKMGELLGSVLRPLDVFITLGAGDVTGVGRRFLQEREIAKMRVALLCGGTSSEHLVSLDSARAVEARLNRSFYDVQVLGVSRKGRWQKLGKIEEIEEGKHLFDEGILRELLKAEVAIPVFHGPEGEDGMIQGFLQTLQLPYVGCDYRSAAVCMQKSWTKSIARNAGIPTTRFIEVESANIEVGIERIQRELTFPVWVKPAHLGSSIGVKKVVELNALEGAIKAAFDLDCRVIVEEDIRGKEIEFAVLGNEHLGVAPCCEILTGGLFYDYERKYISNPMGVAIPALISPMAYEVGKDLALKVYRTLGCQGLARVDFFYDERGHFWLNEVNPMPGFTGISGYPKMWEKAGLSFDLLWDELIVCALHKARKQGKLI